MINSQASLANHSTASDSSDVLFAIQTVGKNMAIWERPEHPDCRRAIEALLSADEALMLDLRPDHSSDIIEEVSALAGKYGEAPSMYALAEDIRMLAELFCRISDAGCARIRLWRVEDDACRLFHADTLHMRMLCTYAGPGTEWLENDNARYNELGSRGRSVEETNNAIVINPEKVRHLAPWHVAVFTGRLRKDTPPLIHRSASLSHTPQNRIRLCIDLPDACGC